LNAADYQQLSAGALAKEALCATRLHHDWSCVRDGRLLSIVANQVGAT
jgi:hypothetical protein